MLSIREINTYFIFGMSMKQIRLFLIAALIGFSCPVIADDRQDISQLIDAYGQAMSTSDIGAVMRLYTINSIFMPAGLPTAVGWHAVKKAYEQEFQTIDLDVKDIVDEIVIGSNMAYARTRAVGHLIVLATNEKKNTENYRAFFTLKKQHGEWKISRFMFNFAK